LLNGKIILDYRRKKHETERRDSSDITGDYENKPGIPGKAYHEEMSDLYGGHVKPGLDRRPGTDSYIAASVNEQAWGRGAQNKSRLVVIGHRAVQNHYNQVETKKEVPKPDLIQELPADNYGDYKRPPYDIFK